MNDLIVTKPRPNIQAGAIPQAFVPVDIEQAYRLANAIHASKLAPKQFDTPEKILHVIALGAERGLTPFMALQGTTVINGKLTIYGDVAIALVRKSGLCEYVSESMQGSGDDLTAICKVKRKDEPYEIVSYFSVEDAKRAVLWNKDGPWRQSPKRMLQMRARGFALRDGFSDVLGGMHIREEFDEPNERKTHSPPSFQKQEEDHSSVLDIEFTEPELVRDLPDPKWMDLSETPRKMQEQLKFEIGQIKSKEELCSFWQKNLLQPYENLMPPDQEDLMRIYRLRESELNV